MPYQHLKNLLLLPRDLVIPASYGYTIGRQPRLHSVVNAFKNQRGCAARDDSFSWNVNMFTIGRYRCTRIHQAMFLDTLVML